MDRIIHAALCSYRNTKTDEAQSARLGEGAKLWASIQNARFSFEFHPDMTKRELARRAAGCPEGCATQLWNNAQRMRQAALADAVLPNGPFLTEKTDAAFWQAAMDALSDLSEAEQEGFEAEADSRAHARFCEQAYGPADA
jgi:hypothetical protein